ncbi:MAG: hypothetical protein CVU00_03940 [Bacteroidetes bacterium HGW-Bacteroidetes-17]|jgi:hypothetical protein|nr:MAG: hypothetical protein CVU00_03940 [Bacteroidetes bacterium HGW-Bacteroidetes-17]
MPVKRKRKARKTIYKIIDFKLSARQKKSLRNYCKARKTTPTKLIKKMIAPFINNYADSVPEELYNTANQLDLFEE